jgi:hypothetical protein
MTLERHGGATVEPRRRPGPAVATPDVYRPNGIGGSSAPPATIGSFRRRRGASATPILPRSLVLNVPGNATFILTGSRAHGRLPSIRTEPRCGR